MRKLIEMKVTTGASEGSVEITAVFDDSTYGVITVCYANECGEVICVYDGNVNTEDPGVGPLDEFANKHDAIESEYGDEFDFVFNVVSLVTAE